MTKETNFEHPPKGHLALLAYDSVNDRWQAVHVDDSGNLQVDITAIVDGQIRLYAWNGDSWEKVTIDASGHLQVDVAAAVALNVQQYQYTGAAWVKSNLLWGYHDIWDENLGGIADAATYTGTTSSVPEGEVWVLTAISIRNNTDAGGHTDISIVRASGAVMFLNYASSVARYEPLLVTGNFILGEGDYANVYMAGIESGDVIKAGLTGYKMDIAM